jgi:hypothetical protein
MTTDPTTLCRADTFSRSSAQTSTPTAWTCRAPLLIAATLVFLVTAFNLVRLINAAAPRNPWEAAQVVEAWRSLRGMPVYELAPDGHSTQVYGALVPWVQGEIFRWVGPNNVSGRFLTLASALAVVALIVATMSGERSIWYVLVAAAVIIGANNRTNQYFAENRPDMTAMMFATAGILLIGLGQERRRGILVGLGTACLVVGFFFKQTVFIFAAVPLVALVVRRRWPARSELFYAMLPLSVSCGMILALKIFSPTVYHYMITVNRVIGLDLLRSARCIWDLLIDSPLFLVLLADCIVFDPRSLERDPRVRWLFAVMAITIPFSAIAAGKIGGASNSLLPALLPMTAFCVLRLPRLLGSLQTFNSPLPIRLAQGAVIALLILMSTFPHMTRSTGLIQAVNPWDREYKEAIRLVESLPGTVICPEDPTIPVYAKNYAGQNIFSEYDAHLVNGDWPKVPPAMFVAKCRAADYVVDIKEYCQDLLTDDLLQSLGFEPAPEMAADLLCYRIWRRKPLVPAAISSRTVLNESNGHGDF